MSTKEQAHTATPGPWTTDAEVEHQAVLGPNGFMVADCAIFSLRKGAPSSERRTANARLIAASPTLYEFVARKASEGDADAARIISSI